MSQTDPKKRKRKVAKSELNNKKPIQIIDPPKLNSPSPSNSSLNPTKRPRGRPPLQNKKNSLDPSTETSVDSSPQASPLSLPPPTPVNLILPPPVTLPPVQVTKQVVATIASNPIVADAASTTNPGSTTQEHPTKAPRPAFKTVVQKVLSKLMISDPVSVNELTKKLVDIPRDMIQSVIEITQVFGLIIQRKAKDGYRPDCPAGTVVYSLNHFAKVYDPIPIDKIEEDMEQRIVDTEKCKYRLEALKVLNSILFYWHYFY